MELRKVWRFWITLVTLEERGWCNAPDARYVLEYVAAGHACISRATRLRLEESIRFGIEPAFGSA